jgi:hypothetical protein
MLGFLVDQEYGGTSFLRNVGITLPDYTALYSRNHHLKTLDLAHGYVSIQVPYLVSFLACRMSLTEQGKLQKISTYLRECNSY